jgi:hypothetical protein
VGFLNLDSDKSAEYKVSARSSRPSCGTGVTVGIRKERIEPEVAAKAGLAYVGVRLMTAAAAVLAAILRQPSS